MSDRDPRVEPRLGDVLRTKRITRKVLGVDFGAFVWVSETKLDRVGYPMELRSYRRWAKGAEIVTAAP